MRVVGSVPHDAPWLEQQIVRAIGDLTAPRQAQSVPQASAPDGPYRTNSVRDTLIDVASVVRTVAASPSADDPASALLARLESTASSEDVVVLSAAIESFLALCTSHPALITALRSDIFEGLDCND